MSLMLNPTGRNRQAINIMCSVLFVWGPQIKDLGHQHLTNLVFTGQKQLIYILLFNQIHYFLIKIITF